MQDRVTKKPVTTVHCGPVQGGVWADSKIVNGTMMKFYSIRIDKAYKEGDEWKHTTTFSAEDLPKVSVVAMEAYRLLRVRTSGAEEC